MPYRTTAPKSPTRQAQDTRAAATAGPHGIALVPPAYGLDVVDRAPASAGPLQCMPVPGHATMQPQTPAPPPNRTGLPDTLKAGIESLSGYDMSDVRVHYNSSQPAQRQALAYTQETEIYVAPGQARHLPHEAWHVVQQKQRRVQPTWQLKGEQVNDEQGLEREAEVMGRQAIQRQRPDQPAPGPAVQAVTAGQRTRALMEVSQLNGALQARSFTTKQDIFLQAGRDQSWQSGGEGPCTDACRAAGHIGGRRQ